MSTNRSVDRSMVAPGKDRASLAPANVNWGVAEESVAEDGVGAT